MNIEGRRGEYRDVQGMRELYRHDAHCQIVHDSALARGLAEPYVILVDGRTAGYAGVWTKYYRGRVMEFYTFPHARPFATPMFRELLAASEATHIEAQTNMPLMLAMLHRFARNPVEEKILFADRLPTDHPCTAGMFRPATPEDRGAGGEWVVEADGAVVAAGGVLFHYNPPYGDIYMEVSEPARRRGFGTYLVQELKRVCYEAGKLPAARCDPSNLASRRTLEKAGLRVCGRLLAGEVSQDPARAARPLSRRSGEGTSGPCPDPRS